MVDQISFSKLTAENLATSFEQESGRLKKHIVVKGDNIEFVDNPKNNWWITKFIHWLCNWQSHLSTVQDNLHSLLAQNRATLDRQFKDLSIDNFRTRVDSLCQLLMSETFVDMFEQKALEKHNSSSFFKIPVRQRTSQVYDDIISKLSQTFETFPSDEKRSFLGQKENLSLLRKDICRCSPKIAPEVLSKLQAIFEQIEIREETEKEHESLSEMLGDDQITAIGNILENLKTLEGSSTEENPLIRQISQSSKHFSKILEQVLEEKKMEPATLTVIEHKQIPKDVAKNKSVAYYAAQEILKNAKNFVERMNTILKVLDGLQMSLQPMAMQIALSSQDFANKLEQILAEKKDEVEMQTAIVNLHNNQDFKTYLRQLNIASIMVQELESQSLELNVANKSRMIGLGLKELFVESLKPIFQRISRIRMPLFDMVKMSPLKESAFRVIDEALSEGEKYKDLCSVLCLVKSKQDEKLKEYFANHGLTVDEFLKSAEALEIPEEKKEDLKQWQKKLGSFKKKYSSAMTEIALKKCNDLLLSRLELTVPIVPESMKDILPKVHTLSTLCKQSGWAKGSVRKGVMLIHTNLEALLKKHEPFTCQKAQNAKDILQKCLALLPRLKK